MTLFPPSTHTPHQSPSLLNYTFNLSLTNPFVATPDTEALVRCLFSLELEPGQQTLYGLNLPPVILPPYPFSPTQLDDPLKMQVGLSHFPTLNR